MSEVEEVIKTLLGRRWTFTRSGERAFKGLYVAEKVPTGGRRLLPATPSMVLHSSDILRNFLGGAFLFDRGGRIVGQVDVDFGRDRRFITLHYKGKLIAYSRE